MDFKLIKDKTELEGTVYFEFLPGLYDNKTWNTNSVFLSEESMAVIEDIFEKNCKLFNHYSFCRANKEELMNVLTDLEIRLKNLTSEKQYEVSGSIFSPEYYSEISHEIEINKQRVICMIEDLINWIKITLKEYQEISMLGI